LIEQLSVKQKENPLLDLGPLTSFVLWIEVIVPSFTTMLTLATWKIVGDECPLLSTNLFYETHKSSVLIWRPHLLFVGTESTI
jgi:hypothetical protein